MSQVPGGQQHVFSWQQCSWVALIQFPVWLFGFGFVWLLFVFTLGFYIIWQECFSTWILWLLTSPIWTICSACSVTSLIICGSSLCISSQLGNFLSCLSEGYTAEPHQKLPSMTAETLVARLIYPVCSTKWAYLPTHITQIRPLTS